MTDEPNNGGTPSRKGLYAKTAKYFGEALDVLVNEMRKGDNSNARIAAARTIVNKVLPDLKATELTGAEGEAMKVLVTIQTKPDGQNTGDQVS